VAVCDDESSLISLRLLSLYIYNIRPQSCLTPAAVGADINDSIFKVTLILWFTGLVSLVTLVTLS
jgi:hypothetical protein